MGIRRWVTRPAGVIWRLIPETLRRSVIGNALKMEAISAGMPGLKNLLRLGQDLDTAINLAAMNLERGVHPKHRLMKYHDFFVDRIGDGDVVADIGCGYGAVANTIAERRKAEVYGLDFSTENIAAARQLWRNPRLRFIEGDALKVFPVDRCDVVVLSNVLEHIEDRIAFLRRVSSILNPHRILIRVPIFERDWTVAYRRELGIPYFLDDTHFVEHTQEGWLGELATAGLQVLHHEIRWGEFWCECSAAVSA